MKKLLRLLIWLVALGIGLGVYAWKQWNKPHTDFTQSEAAAVLTASELVGSFANGTSPWLNQPVEVRGVLVEMNLLEGGVLLRWESLDGVQASAGDEVAVQGRVVGYDDLFGEVRMDHCVLR